VKLSKQPILIGVTGTNGKTTVTHLIADLLSSTKCKTAIIGTLGFGSLDKLLTCDLTTPDQTNLTKIIDTLMASNIKTIAMEVSSHGLVQNRIQGLDYHTVIFNNLSQDHLDYHLDMEEYFLAKVKLFTDYTSKYKIINTSTPYGARLARLITAQPVITYSFQPGNDSHIHIEQYEILADKTIFTLNTPWGKETFVAALIGKFNVENLTAAIIACCLQGVSLVDLKLQCNTLLQIPGRMQFFRQGNSPTVVVDFAHTDAALAEVLQTLKKIVLGKLWCVFGCGGNRDKVKRNKMLQVAKQYSDRIIITQDNPRDEDPRLIVQDMLGDQPIENNVNCNISIDLNRQLAIQQAVTQALAADVVLIAGKGHENYQIIQGEKLPFSDQQEVQTALSLRHQKCYL
jgi:UDP-N-acetylmuramoyl-L-alanyl-D-glutamate--2,6-diaminopimelate ligase